jgi:membrane associated rhomboid family serine protease
VISNALSGLLVFSAVLSTVGRARGWLLLLVASLLGNLAVAAANYPAPYSSVGASTAIFAGVGLLTGRAIRIAWRSVHPHRWRAMFTPFAAGATVLALYGAGGQRVDVGATSLDFWRTGVGFRCRNRCARRTPANPRMNANFRA